ncbi:MAG: 30S ribosomal protein S4 [Planctomycetota bacterium]|nr:30S ribosomal protein S4 [Planctomycetota bacterium]
MGRTIDPKCKLCRRESIKLFLKGDRCHTKKCSLSRRDRPPGIPRFRRGKPSEYSIQLREKQKIKRLYGVWESQFRRYFDLADRMKGNTGENLLILLERRFDNVLYKAGLAVSRAQARQYINHGHFALNGKKVDIASLLVKPGDEISSRLEKSSRLFRENLESRQSRSVPSWLEVDLDLLKIRMSQIPTREEVEETLDVDVKLKEQLIVEFCSK